MFHCDMPVAEWREESVAPFTELIMSWNGSRPTEGAFHFYVSVKTDEWSPWLFYASWGSEEQTGGKSSAADIEVCEDTLTISNGQTGNGFQIKTVTEGSASLKELRSLHVYTNQGPIQTKNSLPNSKVDLVVQGLSQMALDHVRHTDLCSPTSTTAVVRTLLNRDTIDPIEFASKAWDKSFDIYGNWVLNVAAASSLLGPQYSCWVERLSGFEALCEKLAAGIPVVVSIKGPIKGGALPYQWGHLIVVKGYDPETKQVLCMDPAFPKNEETLMAYPLSDFLEAWNRRKQLAYIFNPR